MNPKKLNTMYSLGCFLALSIFSGLVIAEPVGHQKASLAVRGWLKHNRNAMEASLRGHEAGIQSVVDAENRVIYYVVNLDPEGFVVLTADNEIEPVIAFSATGHYEPAKNNPLKDLLEQDITDRLDAIKQGNSGTHNGVLAASGKNSLRKKWQELSDAGAEVLPQADGDNGIQSAGTPSVSDVRVSPLLQSKWGQGDAAGSYCYNYYTPNHYVTGCVATAMAQVMRYYSWPTSGIGVRSFVISVDGVDEQQYTRGGDGSGGPYNWSSMVYNPEAGVTDAQRQAIGALCYDAGLSVGMGYTLTGSGASTSSMVTALKSTFGYSNAFYGYGFSSSGDSDLWGMINADLDAALPAVISITGPDAAHAVVVDGYGYNNSTLYHHLNMGWGGLDDAWYQLPNIDSGIQFNAITGCVYNIYQSGTGEIVSGRITSLAGAALEDALITAKIGSASVKEAITNSRGIYALKNLASNTQYRISVVKSGYTFSDQYITTGRSQDWNSASGNKWGINFTASNPMPPTALNQGVDANSFTPKTIQLVALDDHIPNPPDKLYYTIVSLPSHGTLSEPNVGIINTVPCFLTASADSVQYMPCPYYNGQDSFAFKANDGGTAPTGGDSNIATISINVDNKLYSEFGVNEPISTNTMINTTCYASRSQVLYLNGDIGEAKNITDLSINFTGLPPIPLQNWTIRMQHTNRSQYNDVVEDFLTSGWTMVYQGDLTVSQTGWMNMHFQTPFNYNGAQNLLIEFSFNNDTISAADTGWYLYKDTGNVDRAITITTSDQIHPDPLTWDFWSGGGRYWGGGWLPSIKLIGNPPVTPLVGDFDMSCNVRLPDLAMLSAAWMTQQGQVHYNPVCDISNPKNNAVDLGDLIVFASHWLQNY